jgi:pre-mRNA-splicing factor CWC22
MKAQAASPTFTNVYAALVAIINTKMPEVGELLVKRLVDQFLKSFRRHNRAGLLPTVKFIAHLTNQQVVDPLLPLQILLTLLHKPSDDSVEVATVFIKECGLKLEELAPQGFKKIFEQFRSILHEGAIDRRTQYMIEDLFAVRKTHFQDYPAVLEALDLVEEDDAILHVVSLEEHVDPQEDLNYFQEDPNYLENEEKYDQVRKEILGDSDEESSEGSGSSDDESEEEDGGEKKTDENKMVITDNTDLETVNLKRHIYLTIMSSLDFEECAHKLKKMNLQPGQEPHLAQMIIECCAQERTFLRFYALLAQRFCQLEMTYMDLFQKLFVEQYENIHRLETNKLRNVAKLFSHLLHTDAMSWSVLEAVHLNEQETTSSSRIFIKILFQELAEYMGLVKLNARLQDPYLRQHFTNIMPKDNPKNTRFAINFFTSIGLGGLTDDLREFLRNAPKQVIQAPVESSSSSSDSSDSSSDSDSDSSSDSSDSSSSSSSSSSSDSRDRKRRRTK